MKKLIQGGNDLGNLTLTHFFAFHVFILPASLLFILIIHLYLFRRNGVTPHWKRTSEDLSRKTEPFWPRQLTYDIFFITVIVSSLALFIFYNHGASLEAPADPSSSYLARPEWYFRWLFELLKIFPGQYEGYFVLGFCIIAFFFLAALPLVDRSPSPSFRNRWPHFLIAFSIGATILWLTMKSLTLDAVDSGVVKQREIAEQEAQRAFVLAQAGIPPGGAIELYKNDPVERGRRLFSQNCESCHSKDGKGGDTAPDLSEFMTPKWVRGVIASPTSITYFGHSKITGMDPTDATEEELDALTDYVMSLGGIGKLSAQGSLLFDDKGCATCHARTGEKPKDGPSLIDYGSKNWVMGIIKKASSPIYYGEQNQMPDFEGKLTDSQIEDLLVYLMPQQRGKHD